jgi:SPP1 family phage portal protein
MQKTYQDLLAVGEREDQRMEFVRSLINMRNDDPMYRMAVIADQYDRHLNVTIREYQKMLYTVSGKAIPDNYSANYKMSSRFFNRFVVQEVQYLLGNGISWEDDDTVKKVGKDFDSKVQKCAKDALVMGVAFGFFNLDHLEVFDLKEFIPLYDEENGSLSAGVRYWQINPQKPLRATLYEMDGYTDYIWRNSVGEVLHEKKPYITKYIMTEADGTMIYDGENYPAFPIVPLWGNPHHQSELIGLREQIDCHDLIKSGYANTVDEASLIYWTIKNAGGMDDVDMAEFLQRIRQLHVATATDEAYAEPHQLEAPYNSREALLDRLRSDLYEDAMALDTKNIAGGVATATQIRAAYEPLNNKADQFAYCVLDFLQGIMAVAGIEDKPTFTPSMIVNKSEEIQTVVQAAPYLPDDYVTRKVLTIFGDIDQAEDILKQMSADELSRITLPDRQNEQDEPENEQKPPDEDQNIA